MWQQNSAPYILIINFSKCSENCIAFETPIKGEALVLRKMYTVQGDPPP